MSVSVRDLFQTDDKAEQMRFGLLLLFAATLPFDMLYSSLILIVFFVATLVDVRREKWKLIPRQVYIFQAIFFLALLGYAYSYKKSSANFLIERQLSILLLPLFLPLAISSNAHRTNLLLGALAYSTAIAICYLFAKMVWTITFELKLPLFKTMLSGAFFNHQFSRPLNIHAGYLALYVSLSVLYFVHYCTNKENERYRYLALLPIMMLLAGLFFLAARNTIIATLFILIFVFPFFKIKKKLRYISICLLSLTAIVFVVNSVPYLRERFFTELITDINPMKKGGYVNFNSAEPRVERWQGAWELIKRSPVIGYGTGDEILMLKTEYIKRGLFISYLEEFNAHNQYLSYLIKNGIVGLMIFLAAFAMYMYYAIKRKDFLYTSFLLLLLIGFYTENILDANKGIFFFAFFNTVFGYQALSELKEIRKSKNTKLGAENLK